MYGYIYLTTNNINGKQYIGQKKSNEFLGNKYLGSGRVFTRAVKKYGRENFTVELLEKCKDANELNEREIYWIEYYNAFESEHFYNLCKGGCGCSGRKHTEEEKHKISENQKGNKRNDDCKLKLRNSRLGRVHINNGTISKCIPEDELDEYLSNGWVKGRIINIKSYQTKEFRENMSKHSVNNRWVHNDKEAKIIKVWEIEKYLSEGYVLGRGKVKW